VSRPPRPPKKKAARARQEDDRRRAALRPAWIAVSLAAVLALQLWTCRGRFGAPFLDTRLHYHYDNAEFSFDARSGLRNGDLRSQFGVTQNTYARWGERTGPPTYYTDHPFLMKALFQQWARVAGTSEWAPRAFSLGVSFLVAAGLYAILLLTTGSLAAALGGAAVLVSIPLFALYQTTLKFETDGMLAGVWMFAALLAHRRSGSRRSLAAYGLLTGLAVLTHWTAALFVGVVAAVLLVAALRGDSAARRALPVTAGAAALGLAALAAAMSYLQGSPRAAWQALARSLARRAEAIPAGAWWPRQRLYARMNFGESLPWIVAALSVFLAIAWLRSRGERGPASRRPALPEPGLLAVFFAATLVVAAAWLFAFRQGSFVHVYWQYWFCLPVAVLVGASLATLRTGAPAYAAGCLACAILVAHLASASKASYEAMAADQLGTAEDIAFLTSLREDRFARFVFVPITDTPLNPWFAGPLFEYYTDRAVAVAAAPEDVRPGDKALVLRYKQREDVLSRLAAWSRERLVNEKCGLRICAYDVLAP
jgi:hypothetical protein